MLPENSRKILQLLLRDTGKIGFNINQIARTLKISVGSAFKVLKELEQKKIVLSQKIGNASYFQLNLENPEALALCEFLLLEEKRGLTGYPKLYSDSLQSFPHAELIILFGSILKKKEFKDVDVLFVTKKVKEVQKFCLELSKMRTKPVVPLILTKEGFVHEIKAGKEALLSILREGVVLKGERVFLEVMKDAKK